MSPSDDSIARLRPLITASVMLATIMQALDTTIANVALPHIAGSVSATQDQISWVLTSYIVAAAIATPLTGWLSSRLGLKRVFLISVAGFTVASMLCGMAASLTQIVFFRLLQGVFGAALVPLSQAVLLDIYPRERHGAAMATWGAGIMVGPILGPTLGGWLTDNYDWRWVFYINLPVGLLAFAGIASFIRDQGRGLARRFDFLGFLTLSLGVAALQMMLDRGELKDWFGSTEIWIEAIGAVLGFYLFAVHTATDGPGSFLDRALLRNRSYLAGVVLIFFVGMILYGTLALLPPMLQSLFDYPVVTTGLATAPRGVGTMAAMILVGKLSGRMDSRLIVLSGLSLVGLSMWSMSHFSLAMDARPVVVSGIIQGIGLGFTFVPLSTMAFATLPVSLRTDGAAMYSLARNVGGSIGISMVETLLSEQTQIIHAGLVQHIRPDNPLAQPPVLPSLLSATPSQLAQINAGLLRQAEMIAYNDVFYAIMITALLCIPLLLLFGRTGQAAPKAAPAD